MDRKKCVNCSEHKRCKESRGSWVFFIIGLVATMAIRAVTALAHIDPVFGQAAWYTGVIGFFIFFLYKFKVDKERSRLIITSGIMEKISKTGISEKEDRELVKSLLCAVTSSKDALNYFFIFSSSLVALAIAAYFDFIK